MQPPRRGTLLRAAVIRGDLVSAGLVAVLAAIGVAGAAVAGVLPVWTLAVAVVVAGAGAGLVAWSRAAWRALLAETAAAHAHHEPGPSPVPWVDDAAWRRANRFDPEVDGPVLLLGEVDPLFRGFGPIRGFGQDATGAFTEVTLRPVLPEERELAPEAPVPEGVPVPEPGDAPTLMERLLSTPGRFVALGPRWPICCNRPATLLSVLQAERPPDAFWLPPEPGTVDPEADRSGRGIHSFQCRACGRRYATDPAW